MFPEYQTMTSSTTLTVLNTIVIIGIVLAAAGSLYLRKSNKALHQRALKAKAEELN